MLRHMLEEELAIEKETLTDCQNKFKKYRKYTLTYTHDKRGFGRFYYQKPGQRKRKYIKKGDEDFLRGIAYGRYVQKYIDILEQNIIAITKLLKTVSDTDPKTITSSLPNAYRKAIEMLKETKSNRVLQSENPYKSEELKHEADNGLLVRSIGELVIANLLIRYGIDFQYEKKLELTVVRVGEDGSTWEEKIVRYPDFTIFLEDGSVIYWEHFGMFDVEDYRDSQFEKLKVYYDNGIYPPRNLIVTMVGDGKPIKSQDYIDIIKGRILPYV